MATLPKISYPTLNIAIPPGKKKYMFRPMLVKEEKLLLMAKVSEQDSDILSTIKQVVALCSIDPSFNVDSLPLYALEYIFVQLRGFSIGDVIKVSYRDLEDDKTYDFEVALKNVTINYPENVENKIAINDRAGIVMKYPSADLYDNKEFLNTQGEEGFYKMIVHCIDQIYDGDAVYEGKEFEEKDLLEFIELMDIKSFVKVNNFMTS